MLRGMLDTFLFMTRFNQKKFSSASREAGYQSTKAFESKLTTTQVESTSDEATIGKEAIRCERLGLLEDAVVQSIRKAQ